MKHKLAILVILLSSIIISQNVKAYDFSSISPSGHTLYYCINNAVSTVYVTYPNSDPYAPYDGYVEPTGTLIIPNTVEYNGNNYPVVAIGDWAFAFCANLDSVSVPPTVRSIGDCAFGACSSLSSITIPDSLTYIGVCAFQDCAFDTFTIPASITSISNFAFKNCTNLTYLSITSNINNIGFMAFDSCFNLSTISIGTYTFYLYTNDSAMGSVQILLPTTTSWDKSFTIKALPKEGYRFYAWDNGSTDYTEVVYLERDSSITAFFSYLIEPNICMVSTEDKRNVVYFEVNENALQYKIYREGNISNEYELLSIVNNDSIYSYTDTSSRPNNRSYRYRISCIDRLNFESESSSVHKTMHLTISQGVGGRWNLQWTPYEGAEYSTYIIYRGTNAEDMEQIDIMPADGNTSYTDEGSPTGDVYYQVGIVMSNPCSEAPSAVSAKSTSISRSNIATNSSVGINSNDYDGINVYSRDGRIIVDGTNGESIAVYDMFGRNVGDCSQAFPIGVYIVKIGNHPARKVVVVR